MAAKKKRARSATRVVSRKRVRKATSAKPAKKTAKKAAGRKRRNASAAKSVRASSRGTAPKRKAPAKAKRKAPAKAKRKAPAKAKRKAPKLAARIALALAVNDALAGGESIATIVKQAKRIAKFKSDPKPKAPKQPKAPKKREQESLFWVGYFKEVLETIRDGMGRMMGVLLPSKVKHWRSDERADATLTIDISQAPDAAVAVQKALGDNMIDYLSQKGGFFMSFAFAGRFGAPGSPTLAQAGGTAETWPTQNLSQAIDTVEGTPRIPGMLRNLLPHLEVGQITLRLHWNPYGEQPERMG